VFELVGLAHLPMALTAAQATALSAVIGAVIALITTFGVIPLRTRADTKLLDFRLNREYQQEQRKSLKDVVARHHGRLLETAEGFKTRLWSIYESDQGPLLDPSTAEGRYYLQSTALRLLHLAGVAQSFERSVLFIDSRVADPDDEYFLRYTQAIRWTLSDPTLFKGLEPKYPYAKATDHIYSDRLRHMSGLVFDERGTTLGYYEFEQLASSWFVRRARFKRRVRWESGGTYDPVLKFLDRINPGEGRPRWDRLVSLHLVLLAFANRFGYKPQRAEESDFLAVARRIRQPQIYVNLAEWMKLLGLNGEERGVSPMLAALADAASERGFALRATGDGARPLIGKRSPLARLGLD
jgi:hypothetical protein